MHCYNAVISCLLPGTGFRWEFRETQTLPNGKLLYFPKFLLKYYMSRANRLYKKKNYFPKPSTSVIKENSLNTEEEETLY
jgi:hypothetical protein